MCSIKGGDVYVVGMCDRGCGELTIGLFYKGVEFVLKRACGYIVSDGYKQLYFFGGHVHGCVRNASFERLHWCRLSVVLRKY